MKFESEVLYSNVGISFWGGVCPITGTIIDHTHSLYGECIADKILCIPSGRGSCTGSQVMLELLLNGKGPRAIILRDADSILCTGAIVAEEFFKDECPSIPIICAVKDQFSKLQEYSSLQVFIQKENVNGQEKSQVIISSSDNGYTHSTQNLMELSDTLEIDPAYDLENQSEATRMAFQTVKRVAAISNATKLLPIACAHIDAVTFIGQGGLRFAQKLAELGGKVSVPTTLNSQSVDRRRWAELGVDASLAKNANAVGDAYLKLGAEMSFTCAPYL
jgi:predicted aconitase with swiveling domain